jgi:hypothetical protein
MSNQFITSDPPDGWQYAYYIKYRDHNIEVYDIPNNAFGYRIYFAGQIYQTTGFNMADCVGKCAQLINQLLEKSRNAG